MHLFLDVGNVLATFDHRKACRRLAQVAKVDDARLYTDLYLNSRLLTDRQTGKLSGRGLYEFVSNTYGVTISYEDFSVLWGDIFSPGPSQIVDLLCELPRRSFIVVVSNTEELHWQYILKLPTVEPLLTRRGTVLCPSHLMSSEKPSARYYQRVSAEARIQLENAVLIDDREENLAGFAALGGQTAWFDLRVHTPEDLEQILCRLK